jgi:hypothetical protein
MVSSGLQLAISSISLKKEISGLMTQISKEKRG